jgi:hypothetical protein
MLDPGGRWGPGKGGKRVEGGRIDGGRREGRINGRHWGQGLVY